MASTQGIAMSSSQLITGLFLKSPQLLDRIPERYIWAACFSLTLTIGAIDFWIGWEVSLAFIYAIPISLSAWFAGKKVALALAGASIALSAAADFFNGLHVSGPVIPVINFAIRIFFYYFLIAILLRLHWLQRDLEQQVVIRATELARETAHREQLEHELLDISEREQRRMGRDLHDGLCQHLTGTALASQTLAQRLGETNDASAKLAHRIVTLTEEAIVLARGTAKGLCPVELSADGLMQALEEFCFTTSDVFRVSCKFECGSPVLVHSPNVAINLYRISQEAVSNAIKHGAAREISVILEETDTGLSLAVCDDGVGLPPLPSSHKGMGLRIMADRARIIGGELSIVGNAHGGTDVICAVERHACGPTAGM